MSTIPQRLLPRLRQLPPPATAFLKPTMSNRNLSTSPPSQACKPSSLTTSSSSAIPNTSIRIFRTLPSLRHWRRTQRDAHRTIGLVPTMGALHSGHLSLIRQAASETSAVVVSIYVNPAQFGVHEDLASYPQTWDSDCALLRDLDRELAEDGGNLGTVAAVFAPTDRTMYPSGFPGQEVDAKGSFVSITPAGEKLEGVQRPTFFRGVATVCMKLFNIVTPEKVYFGQKDVQQTVVIRKMVKDFCMDTEVRVGATVREKDGLAMSSRNVYLGTRRRARATVLSSALKIAEARWKSGVRTRAEILGPAEEYVRDIQESEAAKPANQRVKFEIGYLSLADPETLEEVEVVEEGRGAVLSGAFKMLPVEEAGEGEDRGLSGGPAVRLIDNIILEPVVEEA
ncbi:pantoate-beta-alanine ligase [Pseudogymnoascus sp. 03VT05]|nr:pantoate-beta-alanine ligase [Pseudogymnoascus sp. 03VT05]